MADSRTVKGNLGLYLAGYGLFTFFALVFFPSNFFSLSGTPNFPLGYFILLVLLNSLFIVAVLLDDQTEQSIKTNEETAGFHAGCLSAYFIATLIIRSMIANSAWTHGIGDPELTSTEFFFLWFYGSWLIWFGLFGWVLRGIWQHHEGVLRIVFLSSGGYDWYTQMRRDWTASKEQHAERREVKERYQNIKREEEELKNKLRSRDEANIEDFFKQLENITPEIKNFQGYLEEAYRRWVERQLEKTTRITRGKIEETGRLYAAWSKVQREKINMRREYEALKRVNKDVEIDELEQEIRLEELRVKKDEILLKKKKFGEEERRETTRPDIYERVRSRIKNKVNVGKNLKQLRKEIIEEDPDIDLDLLDRIIEDERIRIMEGRE